MSDKDNPAPKKRGPKKAKGIKKKSPRKNVTKAKEPVRKKTAADKTAIYNWSVDVANNTKEEDLTQQEIAQQESTLEELNNDELPKPVRVPRPFPASFAETSEALSIKVQERRQKRLAPPEINYPPDFETEEEFHTWMLRGNNQLRYYFWSSLKSCEKHGHWIRRDESFPEVPEGSSLPPAYLRHILGSSFLELHGLQIEVMEALKKGEKLCCKNHEYLVERLKKLESGELRIQGNSYN
ncbi:hypothetical protein BZA77DRAFT_349419 [Pyronema omphalodes]|nr:hypothetical protein BZA77DRAFT_349419 [Pyronema omphalodes]